MKAASILHTGNIKKLQLLSGNIYEALNNWKKLNSRHPELAEKALKSE